MKMGGEGGFPGKTQAKACGFPYIWGGGILGSCLRRRDDLQRCALKPPFGKGGRGGISWEGAG